MAERSRTSDVVILALLAVIVALILLIIHPRWIDNLPDIFRRYPRALQN
jgi:hypothetical protein